jgi:two-component system OmpR family sensor kinase
MMTRRLRIHRLRTQLMVVLVTLLTIAFVLIAVVTAVQLRSFLTTRLDQQLQAAGVRFAVGLEHAGDNDADNQIPFSTQVSLVSGQAVGTLGARVDNGVVTEAAVVGHTPSDPTVQPGSAARRTLARLPVSANPRTVKLTGLGSYRIIVTRGQDGDLLITGLPLSSVEDTIERLLVIEAIVFGVSLLGVGVLGAASVRLALRPLDRVADTAAQVSYLPLSSGTVSLPERVPEPSPESEVGVLSTAFNRMLEHVESSLQQRQASEDRLRRFVADASHELRTPVAVIRGYAELALRTDSGLSSDTEQALNRITNESDRMGHLVDDLLMLARLDSGRPPQFEEVDLTRIALDAVSDARVAGPDQRWQLDLPDEPLIVNGDERGLQQVLINLLANARTHTPAGTTVLTSARVVASGVELTVIDDGPGIPAALQPRIFERFVRGDDTRSSTTGSGGLGLAIVDAIVCAHGGQISVTSEPGNTRVTVTLPN